MRPLRVQLKNALLVVSLMLAPAAWAAGTLQDVGAAARADLESSLKALADLRAQISAEKLPLTREMAALEEQLAGLRRANDAISRGTDTSALDLAALKSELKLRQEEEAYLGTLLEEYRANFESRLDISERQRYAPVITAAKNAAADTALSSLERLALQVSLVKTSTARLEDVIGGTRFAGQAIDLSGVVTDGQFALIGPVSLFAGNGGGAAGLAMPQTGSNKPAVRPLEASLGAGIASLVTVGSGVLPFDPTRGGALKELVQRGSLIGLFEKGGPIMWPLLLASVLALGTVIERIFFLVNERRRRDETTLQKLLDAVETGDSEEARRIGESTQDFVCRALTYALVHREKSISNALMLAQSIEIKRFRRGIAILDTVITLAPLLGLLGTVTGMMSSFSLIGGDLSAPGAITGGIAEALIATAFGLGIAITALIPFNFLNSRAEEARHELDAASTRLELLLHPPREIIMTRPAPAEAAPAGAW